MFIVDIVATLIIATLSGMGIGSGGLMVLYLTLVRGAPQLSAQGFNLLFFLFAVAASMAIHLTHRRIRLPAVALMIAAGLPAAYLGTRLALVIPETWATRIFGIFLVLVGLPALLGRRKEKKMKKI